MEALDVLIVGAGLSGIGAAWHLQQKSPEKRYAIVEARAASGGTWDLFRYPGIRSDSDMFTLGYAFRPWRAQKAIADGPSILRYIRDTAREGGIDRHIRYRHKVLSADFDTAAALWTVQLETPDGPTQIQARMLLMAAGYYSYDKPYSPVITGEDRFAGPLFHAQLWPEGLDVAGKRIAIIGSGATAVTIVPVLAEQGARVTMVQRSPTWMISRPAQDKVANFLRAILPAATAYKLIRWRNTRLQAWLFNQSRKRPATVNRRITNMLLKELPAQTVAAHFQPGYNVWDQRLCLVPDGDFFKALNSGKAEVITDHIAAIDETGIQLRSGSHIDADIIVKATGLSIQMLGGAKILVDGVPQPVPERFIYRGMMIENIPNLLYIFGYFNASWTLRADLSADWFTRLLAEMDRRKAAIVYPRRTENVGEEPRLFASGYVQRGETVLPRQGDTDPWRDSQNYLEDRITIGEGPIEDGVLCFEKARG